MQSNKQKKNNSLKERFGERYIKKKTQGSLRKHTLYGDALLID